MFLSRRGRFYYVWYVDDDGRKQKLSTHSTTKAGALEFLRNLEGVLASRKSQRRHVSLEAFVKDFLEYSQTTHRPKTVRIYRTSLREFQKVIGNPLLDKLSPHQVQRFLAAKKVAVSEASLRTYYTHVASAFEVARKWSLISESPFKVIPKPKMVEKSPVHMSPSEFQRLLSVTRREDLRHLFVAAVCTGLRQGELCALRWEDIDFERRIMHVRNGECFKTKSGRNRVVPLPDQVCRLLRGMQPAAICPLVFHLDGRRLRQEYLSKAFKRCVKNAGLNENLHYHSLRHSFATWLVQAGVSLYEVQKLLGHSSIATTQVYAHLAACELHGAVNKITLDTVPDSVRNLPGPTP